MLLFCSNSCHFLSFFLLSSLRHHLNFMNLTFHITFSGWLYRQLYSSFEEQFWKCLINGLRPRITNETIPDHEVFYILARYLLLFGPFHDFSTRIHVRSFPMPEKYVTGIFENNWTYISFNLTFFLVFFVFLLNVFMHLLKIFSSSTIL